MQSLSQLTPKFISIAPMMGWTNPSMQKITQIIAPNMVFYTQMYHVEAVIRRPDKLTYKPDNLIFQLGGSCPDKFREAGSVLSNIGIKRININVGCPSNKVQHGNFGACLMREPQLVSDCLNALLTHYDSTALSIKCRLGVDHDDSDDFLESFINTIYANTKVKHFIIHARKAWLSGLNPKQNRDIPPLKYDKVYRLKKLYPHLHIGINGGISALDDVFQHLSICDEVMLGRLLLNDIYKIHQIDAKFNQYKALTREAIIKKLSNIDKDMYRFLQPLYKGLPGCKEWRRNLPKIKDNKGLIELSMKTRLFATQEI